MQTRAGSRTGRSAGRSLTVTAPRWPASVSASAQPRTRVCTYGPLVHDACALAPRRRNRGPGAEPSGPAMRPHLLPAPLEQGVVDRHDNRLAWGTSSATTSRATARRSSSGLHRARGEEPVRPVMAPAAGKARPGQHPYTVRFPVCARNPQARPQNVRNDGAVNNGADRPAESSATREPVAWRPRASAETRFIDGFVSTADALLSASVPAVSPDHTECHPAPAPPPQAVARTPRSRPGRLTTPAGRCAGDNRPVAQRSSGKPPGLPAAG